MKCRACGFDEALPKFIRLAPLVIHASDENERIGYPVPGTEAEDHPPRLVKAFACPKCGTVRVEA